VVLQPATVADMLGREDVVQPSRSKSIYDET
jgi:hypothetical protein